MASNVDLAPQIGEKKGPQTIESLKQQFEAIDLQSSFPKTGEHGLDQAESTSQFLVDAMS